MKQSDPVEVRLRRMLSRRCPLVEFYASLKNGVSAEVVCEVIHRLSDSLVAEPAGPLANIRGRSIYIQMDPHAAASLGIVLARVQLNPDQVSAGYKWHCLGNGKLADVLVDLVDGVSLSQPGAYDDAQPWSPG